MENRKPQKSESEEHEHTGVLEDHTRNDYDPEMKEVDQQRRARKRDHQWQSDVLSRMELLENDNTGDYI